MNIALIGPSGVGKGTHVANLSTRYGLRHAATGDLFRTNLHEHTPLGVLARKYMEAGALVPDDVVDSMVEAWADSQSYDDGLLFDGFPRTPCQADFLDDLMHRLGRRLDAMVFLRLSDEAIVSRLSGRLICRECQTPFHNRFNPPRVAGVCDCCGKPLYHRPDDSPEMVLRRLRIFHRLTEPLLERYALEGNLIIVSGEGTVTDVDARLVEALDAVSVGRGKFASREDFATLVATYEPATRPPAVGMDLILLGGPGSGKGTQAELLASALKLPHISTGDLFRENLKKATELGKLAKAYMDRGELVPDDVTDHMVEDRLGRPDVRDGFILDGYPRTLAQAVALEEILSRLGRRITGALNIDVPDSSIVERLSGRLICRSCQAPFHLRFHPPKKAGFCDHCGGELYRRSDDNPATIRTRLATFHRQAAPLIHYYRELGVFRIISGNDAVDVVSARCLYAAKELAAQHSVAAPVVAV